MGSKGKNQIQVCRKFKVQNSVVTWLGEPWICPEQLKHYPACLSSGKMIAVHSFVLIMHEDEESHYLGYLVDLYEDKKGEKKAEVRWFHHNQEVKEVIPQLNTHPEEVLITPDIQVISAELIDQVGTVLNLKHYGKSLALSENLSSGIFLCHREFKRKKVRPFYVSKLRGYSSQRIFSVFDCHDSSKNNGKLEKSNKENEDFPSEDPLKLVTGRGRSLRGFQKLGDHSNAPNSEPPLELKLSKGPSAIKLVGSRPSQSSSSDEKNIELLCQDSGLRGCWHRCKILETSKNRIKVQHYDVSDVVDEPEKLEEWVPASRVAAPDKLNMRCTGRLTVRPWPPQILDRSFQFEFGHAVDAWWSDGWWECVVLAVGNSESENVLVYMPDEARILNIPKNDLRVSRDWVNGKWVDIEPNTEVLSFIASPAGPYGKEELKPSISTTKRPKHVSFLLEDDKAPKSSKPEAPKNDLRRLPASVTTTELEDTERVNVEKRPLVCHNDPNKADEHDRPPKKRRTTKVAVAV